jgi:hypothetical protein
MMNAVLESDSVTEALRRLSIGRIIYCVVAALPVAISLSLWLDPSEPRNTLWEGMLVLLMLMVDIPITIVGIAILIRNKIKHEPLLFWSVAVFIASTPLIALVAIMLVSDLTIRTPQ